MKTKKMMQYEDVLRRQDELKRIQDLGIELVYKKNKIKIVCGSILAVVGIATLPFPTGSIVLISAGTTLMISGGVDVIGYKKKLLNKVKLGLWKYQKLREDPDY